MFDPKKYSISPKSSLKEAIKIIDDGSAQVALVVDSDFKLLGIVTDGDVRRAILRGIALDEPISSIMTTSPIYVKEGSSKYETFELMRQKVIHHVPVVSENMRVVDLFVLDDLFKKSSFTNDIVLMAGGKGERLKPHTDSCPKPMLQVNGKPILEIILLRCIDAGFKNFHISVNYLKNQIIDFFGNGEKWGVKINYLEEVEPLGTCGCLRLLPDNISDDLIVMNGDILTDLDLDRLLRFHIKTSNVLTVCSLSHRVRIPFAVLNSEGNILKKLDEKPLYNYQVNAGAMHLCIKNAMHQRYSLRIF